MTLIITQNTKYYSAKEIEEAIRKTIVFDQAVELESVGSTMIALDPEMANKFVRDFFKALKQVSEKETRVEIKNKEALCSLPDCN